MSLHIALCDDETAPIKHILTLLNKWSALRQVSIQIQSFSNGDAFLFYWDEYHDIDIIFLDIQMGKKSGMDVADKIRRTDQDVIIIFATNFIDYVFRGYEVQAFRYLVKPLKEHDVFSCMDQVHQKIQNAQTQAYHFRCDGQDMRVKIHDIMYIEIFSHKVEMHMVDGKVHYFHKRLKDLEQELPGCFIRSHRSIIVNIHHVFAVKKNALELNSTVELPISESRRDAVNQAFIQYRI